MTIRNETDYGAFIPSFLDDYGLSPFEFRLYAHILRRAGGGRCWESIPNMAKHCQISLKVARRAVQNLTQLGLIAPHVRTGKSTEYIVTNPKEWKSPRSYPTPVISDPGHIRPRSDMTGHPGQIRPATPSKCDRPPLADPTYEGYPIKEIPLREIPLSERAPTRREDSPSDLWEPEAGTGQADPSPAKPDQASLVSQKSAGDGKKGPPAAVEVLANNPDDYFLNGNSNRREYREQQGRRNAINPEVFPTVEAQDEFWAAAIARIMVENPNQQIGKAKAIASGYCKQLNTGENVNPEARQFYQLWKTGGIASAPHVTTAKAAKTQSTISRFMERHQQ